MFLQELLLIKGVHMAIFRNARDSGPGGQRFKSGPLGVTASRLLEFIKLFGERLISCAETEKITIIKQRS